MAQVVSVEKSGWSDFRSPYTTKLRISLWRKSGLSQGMNYCKLGRAGDAVPLLSKAAAGQPSNKQARFWLASALVGSGKAARAVVELEGVPPALREDVDVLQLLGEAYQKAAREQ